VLRKSAGLVLLYLIGAVAVPAWSLSHVFAGTVTSENAAAVIVLPFAWVFGYWGVVGPLLAAWKIWKLQSVLEEHCERRAQGLDTDATEQDVEDALTLLATQENPLPEKWARRIVRLMLQRTPPPPVGEGAYPE
jgi:hypothetical protein